MTLYNKNIFILILKIIILKIEKNKSNLSDVELQFIQIFCLNSYNDILGKFANSVGKREVIIFPTSQSEKCA